MRQITLDSWLAEFQRVSAGADGLTVKEIAVATGSNTTSARRKVEQDIATKKARFVGYKKIAGIDGRLRPTPAYAPVKGNK